MLTPNYNDTVFPRGGGLSRLYREYPFLLERGVLWTHGVSQDSTDTDFHVLDLAGQLIRSGRPVLFVAPQGTGDALRAKYLRLFGSTVPEPEWVLSACEEQIPWVDSWLREHLHAVVVVDTAPPERDQSQFYGGWEVVSHRARNLKRLAMELQTAVLWAVPLLRYPQMPLRYLAGVGPLFSSGSVAQCSDFVTVSEEVPCMGDYWLEVSVAKNRRPGAPLSQWSFSVHCRFSTTVALE